MASRTRWSVSVLAACISLLPPIAFGQTVNTSGAVVIFIDDLHIDFRNTPRLRNGMLRATEQLLGAGRAIAVVSDGSSSIALPPTNDRATLIQVANRVSGGGLKPDETANPTASTIADIKRREAVADMTWESVLTRTDGGAVLYVTERQVQPTTGSRRVVVTRPEGMGIAVAELLGGQLSEQNPVNVLVRCPIPRGFGYSDTAIAHLRRMHEIVNVLEHYGHHVTVVTELKVGYVVYEDPIQVVAEPFADTRTG